MSGRFFCEILRKGVPKQSVVKGRNRRTGKAVWYPPPKGEKWQDTLIWEFVACRLALAKAGKSIGCFGFTGAVSLTVNFYFTNKKHGDLDNLIKPTKDALAKAGIISNDKQVLHLDATIVENATTPKVTIAVEKWTGAPICSGERIHDFTIDLPPTFGSMSKIALTKGVGVTKRNTAKKPWSPADFKKSFVKNPKSPWRNFKFGKGAIGKEQK